MSMRLQIGWFEEFRNFSDVYLRSRTDYPLNEKLKKFKARYSYSGVELLDGLIGKALLSKERIEAFTDIYSHFRELLSRELDNLNSKIEAKDQTANDKILALEKRILELERSISSLTLEG